MTTTVINVRTLLAEGCWGGRYWPEGVVYVGRANPRFALPASPFRNPFPLPRRPDDAARAKCMSAFVEYLRASPTLLGRIRKELVGKRLACWCAPATCHADVLARIADGGDP